MKTIILLSLIIGLTETEVSAAGRVIVPRANIRVNSPRPVRQPLYVRPAGWQPAPRYPNYAYPGLVRGQRPVTFTRQLAPGIWQTSTYLQ